MRKMFCGGDLSGKDPEWYWYHGLHDARILRTEELELDYDHARSNSLRNCFKLYLDSSQCTYDTTVRSISLFNYQIIQTPIERKIDGCEWLGDRLDFKYGKYLLTVCLLDSRRKNTLVIRFEQAEVERNP